MNDFLTRRSGWIILASAIVAAIPLYWPELPPLTDLMGHIGRYSVQLNLHHDPLLQRYYSFQWAMIPNLGVDLLIGPVAAVAGLEMGVKLIVISIVMATVAGFLFLGRVAHGRIPVAAFFSLPLAYGFPFHFGFVNYCLSMALAFLLFACWMRLGQKERIGFRAVLFMPLSVIIWLAHVSGWGALGLFAFASEYVRLREGGRKRFASSLEGLLHCLPLALPAILMVVVRSQDVQGKTGHFFEWQTKFQWFSMALSDRWQGFDLGSVGLIAILIAFAAIIRELRFDRTLGLAAFLLFGAFIVIPRVLIGSAYADMRLAPYIIAMAVLAIGAKPATPTGLLNVIMGLGLLFFGARTVATTASFFEYDRVITAELGAVDQIPVGARVMALTGRTCRAEWMQERRTHLPSVALARRRIFINDQFVMAGAQLLGVHYPAAGNFQQDPSQMAVADDCARPDWRRLTDAVAIFPREAFDYVWVINPPQSETVDYSGLSPVWRWERSALYRINKTAQPLATHQTAAAPARPDGVPVRTGR